MGLEDDQQQDVWNRKVSDTGEENDTQRQSVATLASQTKVKTWRSSNHDQACADKEDTDSSQDQQSPNLPLGCKTFLLTQAATLAGSAITDPSLFSYGLANKVTPASVALESPSSPPVACAASPASHSIDSPSHQTSCSYASSPTTKSTLRKRGVPHIYRDFTNVPDTSGYVRKKTGGVTQPFPEKLHEMLDQVDEPNMVGWLPHGRAFIVRKPKEFTAQIMPKFFRQSKLTSFQRQLNLYGFRRLTQGPDAGAYYHELFLRGRPQLCLRMQRQKVKGTGHKQPADAKTEPNFYTMAPSTYTSPLMSASSPEATSSKEEDSRPLGITYQEMSPGMAGLHGAAHLLKNIAAGVRTSSMGASFSLGESAISSAPLHGGSNVASLPVSPPSSLLVPEGKSNLIYPSSRDQSMSLLGRVNSEQYNPTQSHSSPPSQFAFFWPPDRQKQNPLMDGKEALSPQEIIPPPSQQESAQPTSSHFFKKERANLQASERSIIKAQIETADDEIKVKISDPNTPFSSFGESNEGGRMETKVSNGIETEEV